MQHLNQSKIIHATALLGSRFIILTSLHHLPAISVGISKKGQRAEIIKLLPLLRYVASEYHLPLNQTSFQRTPYRNPNLSPLTLTLRIYIYMSTSS